MIIIKVLAIIMTLLLLLLLLLLMMMMMMIVVRIMMSTYNVYDINTPYTQSSRNKYCIYSRPRPVLTGILTDVSGSMKKSIDDPRDKKAGPWSRSIFKTVDSLVEHDVKVDNLVFAIAYGARRVPQVFDLLHTLENTQDPASQGHGGNQEFDNIGVVLKDFLDILKAAGATYVRLWADENRLERILTLQEAKMFRSMLKWRSSFKVRFITEILPKSCFDEISCKVHQSTDTEVRKTLDKGVQLVWETCKVPVTHDVVMRVEAARHILRYYSGGADRELTRQEVDDLVKTVKPFIYGRTPMMEALSEAEILFGMRRFHRYHKMLVVLSDGIPTDGDTIPDFNDADVTVVSIYITNKHLDNARRLFSEKSPAWDKGARLMYDLGSTITTQKIPRTIFVKRDWVVDITNNQTRLFCQVNHPDVIDDVCSLARDVVCKQDVLPDLLSAVDLDIYINGVNAENLRASRQIGDTCYANAMATVVHLAMKQIQEREGGCPLFADIREALIQKYEPEGIGSKNIFSALQQLCQGYRLKAKIVTEKEAMKAVIEKRPVLVSYGLRKKEKDRFNQFYKNKPRGVLKNEDLGIFHPALAPNLKELEGHAVVLTSFGIDHLLFMNSWGTDWADNGFFRVQNGVLHATTYYDVYWTESDLTPSEREAFKRRGEKVAADLIQRFQGLRKAKFRCPRCHRESLVTEFSGSTSKVRCPKCRRDFNINKRDESANDLVLTMYLLSLSSHS